MLDLFFSIFAILKSKLYFIMKKVFALMIVAGVVALASCKSEPKTEEVTGDTTVTTEVVAADTTAAADTTVADTTKAAEVAPAAH